MRSRRWRSIQSGLPESAHGSPELVKHASLVEVEGMGRNTAFPPCSDTHFLLVQGVQLRPSEVSVIAPIAAYRST